MTSKERLTKFYWFCFGLWVNFPRYVMLWIATEDILAGSLLSTPIVLVAFTAPDILSKALLSPWIVERISFLPAFIIHAVIFLTVALSFVFVNIVNVRLAGMCVLGCANGLGTITAAKLLGFYSDSAGVYQSGCNVATAVASIFYTGLTTWICVSPRIAMAILSPLYLLPPLIYALLDKEPLKTNDNIAKEITYEPLNDKDNDNPNSPTQAKYKNSEKASIGQQLKNSFSEVLLIFYTGMQTFLFQITLTAILSTVTFQSSPFPPRDHYQYYRFVSDGGKMLGGLELSLVSLCCPGFLDIVKIRRVWILVLLAFGHVVVFLSVSWFHYIDNVYIMFILCLTFGVTTGCISVHCFSLASDLIPDSRKLGKVLGYMEVSISVCRLSAGLLGLFVEKYLREHCEHRLLLGRFCIARLSSPGMWITSNCDRT